MKQLVTIGTLKDVSIDVATSGEIATHLERIGNDQKVVLDDEAELLSETFEPIEATTVLEKIVALGFSGVIRALETAKA